LKRNGLLTLAILAVLPLSPLSAQVPAFEALRVSVSALSLYNAVPLPAGPALFSAGRTPEASLSGEQLFSYLHDATAPAPLKSFIPSYKASKAFMYSRADNTGCNGGSGIVTFYSQICVNGSGTTGENYGEQGDANGDGVVDAYVNAEHLWPQSYFNSALPMVADLHHLAPTFATPNSRRGNLKFAEVSRPSYSTSSGSMLGKEGFEPSDAVKGNAARAMFYFIVRYSDRDIRQGMNYNSFWTRNVPMLLKWHRQDPPDAAERRRNDRVEGFQGNRNPFIDNPELADRIGELVFAAH